MVASPVLACPHFDDEDRQGRIASAFQCQSASDPGIERVWGLWEEEHNLREAEPHCMRGREGGYSEAGGDYDQGTESKAAALGCAGDGGGCFDLGYETDSYWELVEGDLVKPEVGGGRQAGQGSAVAR